MEKGKNEDTAVSRSEVMPPAMTGEGIHGGLDEALFKLLDYQARQGADQNHTMIMLALMNLLGIVNCMNRLLPEGELGRGTGDLAAQIGRMLNVPEHPGTGAASPAQIPAGKGGFDPSMLAALASMMGGPPRGAGGPGEPPGRPGLDPAMLAALASMMGGPGGGANPAALMGMLANLMGGFAGPGRSSEAPRQREETPRGEKIARGEEKPNSVKEAPRKEPAAGPRGALKWDPRLGTPTSSN